MINYCIWLFNANYSITGILLQWSIIVLAQNLALPNLCLQNRVMKVMMMMNITKRNSLELKSSKAGFFSLSCSLYLSLFYHLIAAKLVLLILTLWLTFFSLHFSFLVVVHRNKIIIVKLRWTDFLLDCWWRLIDNFL